jgi:hypothetical protein
VHTPSDQGVPVVVPKVQKIVVLPGELGRVEKVVARRQGDAPECARALEQLSRAQRPVGVDGLLDVEV